MKMTFGLAVSAAARGARARSRAQRVRRVRTGVLLREAWKKNRNKNRETRVSRALAPESPPGAWLRLVGCLFLTPQAGVQHLSHRAHCGATQHSGANGRQPHAELGGLGQVAVEGVKLLIHPRFQSGQVAPKRFDPALATDLG